MVLPIGERDWHNLRFHPQSSLRVERLCGKIDSFATKCLRRLVIPTHRGHSREMGSRKLLKIGKNWRMRCKPDCPRRIANKQVVWNQAPRTVNDVNFGSVSSFCVTPASQALLCQWVLADLVVMVLVASGTESIGRGVVCAAGSGGVGGSYSAPNSSKIRSPPIASGFEKPLALPVSRGEVLGFLRLFV